MEHFIHVRTFAVSMDFMDLLENWIEIGILYWRRRSHLCRLNDRWRFIDVEMWMNRLGTGFPLPQFITKIFAQPMSLKISISMQRLNLINQKIKRGISQFDAASVMRWLSKAKVAETDESLRWMMSSFMKINYSKWMEFVQTSKIWFADIIVVVRRGAALLNQLHDHIEIPALLRHQTFFVLFYICCGLSRLWSLWSDRQRKIDSAVVEHICSMDLEHELKCMK